jgi:hypothetical protein
MCNNCSFSIAIVVTQIRLDVMLYVYCLSCCSTFALFILTLYMMVGYVSFLRFHVILTVSMHSRNVGDNQFGFWCSRSATDNIFICQILEKKCEYYEQAVLQLFIDCRKSYVSVRGEVFCNILIKSGIPMKLVRLIIAYPNETHSTFWVGRLLPDTFPFLRMVCNKEMLHHHWFSPWL